MANLTVKDHEELEKDPTSGAVILKHSTTKESIQLDYLVKQIGVLNEKLERLTQIVVEIKEMVDTHK